MFVVFRFFERYGFGVVCSDGRQHVHCFCVLDVSMRFCMPYVRRRAWRRCGWERCE